ncbi:MAG: AAA family ATPase [Rickettsiales bacterium]
MIGFENISTKWTNLFQSNKLHHAIILSGKKGIGKASFAKEFCAKIIDDPNFSNIKIIEKLPEKKEIAIGQIQDLVSFFNHTPALDKPRFLIIDAVCEMNKNSANNLLKNLEEPKNGVFIILIAHNLSKVLPTIKSRCYIEKINEFSVSIFTEILHSKKINLSNKDYEFLSEITDNSPALAITNGEEIIAIYQDLLNSFLEMEINSSILKKIGEKNFSYFNIELILKYFCNKICKNTLSKNVNFYYQEQEVFQMIFAKYSAKNFLDITNDIYQKLYFVNKSNLDKKINFTNIFNQIIYG